MLDSLLATDAGLPGLLLRLTLGIVIFPHGAQKALGWYGGYGWTGTMGFFKSLGIPPVFGALAILAEFVGSIALVTGTFTRVAALAVGFNMLVAIFLVHTPHGFFMNWSGNQKGEGYEYHLLAIGIAVTLLVVGGGMGSVDGMLTR